MFIPSVAVLLHHCLTFTVIAVSLGVSYFLWYNCNQVSERLVPVKQREKAVTTVPADGRLKQT